jgi:hypothetical protein
VALGELLGGTFLGHLRVHGTADVNGRRVASGAPMRQLLEPCVGGCVPYRRLVGDCPASGLSIRARLVRCRGGQP